MLFPERARMLNFTHYNNTIDNYTFDMPQWNVDPRKSPLITTPIAILDMPNITLNLSKSNLIQFRSWFCNITLES